MIDEKYKPVIGLEVHVELKTNSKMFCNCSADYFGQEPNSNTCPVCLGLPGALPVPNKKAIEWCVMIGMALGCNVPLFSKFDRKNYFYPDLPKGYQISQYDQPFAINGSLELKTKNEKRKTIRIRRVHMEEDTAKLTHQLGDQKSKIKNQKSGYSLIDFNRSGVPLVEIVTEPDFQSATDAKEYLQKLHQIVRYLGVSNADMEKGNMRLEPNISLRLNTTNKQILPISNDQLPKYKVEVKNINSFKFVEKAINFEIERQAKLLDKGETPVQETRGWDEKKQATVSQRVKEEANDYRYFPEPDIPPVQWTESAIRQLAEQMPELPDAKFARFKKEYVLSDYNAEILTREKELADYFEEAVKDVKEFGISPKQIANTLINRKLDISVTLPAEIVELIKASSQTVTVDEKELERVIQKILQENEKAVRDFKNGKETVIMYLVGQVMKNFKEKINAQIVKEKILENL